MDSPKFSGLGLEGWIYQEEEYFLFHIILDTAKLQISRFNMTKSSLAWVWELWRNNLISTWEQFKANLRETFEPLEFEDKLTDLIPLQQTSLVVIYLDPFEELLNKVDDQSVEALISFFVGSLKLELKNELSITWPLTLWQDFSLAKIHEANRVAKGKYTKYSYSDQEPLIKTTPPPLTTKTLTIVQKNLIVKEKKEHTTKGLCFNCDENYMSEHRYKGKIYRFMDVKNVR